MKIIYLIVLSSKSYLCFNCVIAVHYARLYVLIVSLLYVVQDCTVWECLMVLIIDWRLFFCMVVNIIIICDIDVMEW